MATVEPNYPIQSVDRALELLLIFREASSVSVSEVAEMLSVSRSTAHRMLAMLQHRGFVQQDSGSKRYLGGPALVEVGLATVRNMDIRHLARPYLEKLVAKVGETAHLQIVQGRSAVFLDGVESGQALRAAQRSGVSLPAHCTAGGKSLLAEMTGSELRALYPNEGADLSQMTANSITTLEDLERELEQVRERGWAHNNEESEAGLRAVAVVIPERPGGAPLRASITVAGPAFRLDDGRAEQIASEIKVVAEEIAKSK